MHFSLLVITKDFPSGTILSDIMEPYDENLEYEHEIEKKDIISAGETDLRKIINSYDLSISSSSQSETNEKFSYFLDIISKSKNMVLTENDLYNFELDVRGYNKILPNGNVILTTYNDNAKWDYWTVGGRFTGWLPAKYSHILEKRRTNDYNPDNDVIKISELDIKNLRKTYSILSEKTGWVDEDCEMKDNNYDDIFDSIIMDPDNVDSYVSIIDYHI